MNAAGAVDGLATITNTYRVRTKTSARRVIDTVWSPDDRRWRAYWHAGGKVTAPMLSEEDALRAARRNAWVKA